MVLCFWSQSSFIGRRASQWAWINRLSLTVHAPAKLLTKNRINSRSFNLSLSLSKIAENQNQWRHGTRNRRSPQPVEPAAFAPSPIWTDPLPTPIATPMALKSTIPVARRGHLFFFLFSQNPNFLFFLIQFQLRLFFFSFSVIMLLESDRSFYF